MGWHFATNLYNPKYGMPAKVEDISEEHMRVLVDFVAAKDTFFKDLKVVALL